MIRVFLSYASDDIHQVRDIYARLQSLGFRPWLDRKDLVAGQRWRIEIPKALKAADFVVVFFSRQSVTKRSYVQEEFQLALDIAAKLENNRIHTIPVRLDDCPVPEEFRTLLQWVDLFEHDGFDRLVTALRMGVGQRSPSTPPKAACQTLKVLLSEERWRDADIETSELMLQAVGRAAAGWMRSRDIDRLACSDLLELDQLWADASEGRFGFRSQQGIWIDVADQRTDFDAAFSRYGDRVGWRVDGVWLRDHSDFDFSIVAPAGHLPTLRFRATRGGLGEWSTWRGAFRALMNQVDNCT